MTKLDLFLEGVFNRKVFQNSGQYFYKDSDLDCNVPVQKAMVRAAIDDGLINEDLTLTKEGRNKVAELIKTRLGKKNEKIN